MQHARHSPNTAHHDRGVLATNFQVQSVLGTTGAEAGARTGGPLVTHLELFLTLQESLGVGLRVGNMDPLPPVLSAGQPQQQVVTQLVEILHTQHAEHQPW